MNNERPVHRPDPLPVGEILTASTLHVRLDKIKTMCVSGAPLHPIITELQYLADALAHIDRSTHPQ